MIQLLKLWLEKLSCKHKWKIHHITKVYEHSDNSMPREIKQTLICQECGKIKRIKL